MIEAIISDWNSMLTMGKIITVTGIIGIIIIMIRGRA